MSVAFFFCISGYLMARSACCSGPYSYDNLGRDTVKFMLRKVKNILPWYLFAWSASFFLLCVCYGASFMTQARMLVESIFPTLLVNMTGLDGFEVVGATWYLSAMYLCMPVLYVLLLTRRDLFIWVVAPLLTLFLYGYMQKVYGGVIGATWIGLCYGGILYAIAGLSCGCFCYGVSAWLKRQQLTRLSRILISFLDFGTFIVCLILMQTHPGGAMNATIAFLFAVVVVMSFSGKSYTTVFFNRFCACKLIREFSIAIYLCHGRAAIMVTTYFSELQSYQLRLLLYLMFALLISILCMVGVQLVKNWNRRYGSAAFYRLFVQMEER